MKRLKVSLGFGPASGDEQVEAEDDGNMSPSPGDDARLPADTKNPGGLASVLKGLTGAARSKPPPTLPPNSASSGAQIAEPLDDAAIASQGLPPNHKVAFEQLRSGTDKERIAAAQQLCHAVVDYPLNPVLDIWHAAKDLIDPTNTPGARVAGWELLSACAKHPSSTDLERKKYFQTITTLATPEDFHLQLSALVALTNNGRVVSGFDYDIFSLITNWFGIKYASVRAARKQAKGKDRGLASGEVSDFMGLFAFAMDLIKFNFSVADEQSVGRLIDALVHICVNTNDSEDLKASIGVLNAIVTYGAIPDAKLGKCIQVLGSILFAVPNLMKDAWHTVRILCRSHNGQAVVRYLLSVLHTSPTNDVDTRKEAERELRSALTILTRLVTKSTEKGYPSIPYPLLADGLRAVANNVSVWRIQVSVMLLVNRLFGEAQDKLNTMLVDEDWTLLLEAVFACAESVRATEPVADDQVTSPRAPKDGSSTSPTTRGTVSEELSRLINRLEGLISQHQGSMLQRQECIAFFAKVHRVLPDSAATLVIDYLQDFRCCFPSDTNWEANLDLVFDAFLANRARPSRLRMQAVQAITEVYDMVELVHDQVEPDLVPGLVKRLLGNVAEEKDIEVLQEIVTFTAGIAVTSEFPLFNYITDTLYGIIAHNRIPIHMSPSSSAAQTSGSAEEFKDSSGQTASNIVTRAFVQVFMRVMSTDVGKSNSLFQLLVSIAKSDSNETDARISAMNLLFRLRADWAGQIFITSHTESDYLAASLYRTEASLARKQADEASQPGRLSRGRVGGPSRSSRGVSASQAQKDKSVDAAKDLAPKYQQLWSANNATTLPEPVSQSASHVLYSHTPDTKSDRDSTTPKDAVLPTSMWLDAVLKLLHGCDWEVYSFVLVYLPSQLSNHGLFRDGVRQLQDLRKAICDQVRTSNIQEPPSASGVRKADVTICLLHCLTMVLSYHEHFQKPEEDEIVNTFIQGLGWERAAKCSIHALSICCYELPLSVSKALVTILMEMSKIVTQPYVAMHILEFLACLSRLPSLYVNFREEEHRIVFGICFRYLQFVREKKQSYRASSSGDTATHASTASTIVETPSPPNAADDLPQYVHALAYHVVTFWFLALKLPDRANHVGWIAKNLFTDVDGSQLAEEQAQTTIDFMQRVTYADVDESAIDPHFTAERFGAMLKKRWLIGNSIVTVEQATASGYAQITKRQPSGTSAFMIKESFKPPPAHQERNTNEIGFEGNAKHGKGVLPSHLMVQLLSSMPQCTDQARPIPLPDDDSVTRAIRMFDHNSTLDGHKVGVIYIGENQTQESEILANISGSGDYVEFLNGLGTLTKLKNATFNAQGLDRQYDTDGQYTFCWRDRVTEIVFHVTTQMPTNLEHDPNCTLKKRHIGNDYVNIIFNDSGLPFNFNTFPSEFNYVNIVITPESRASFVAIRQRNSADVKGPFYKVQVMSKPGFPEISPASETKIISLKALPSFIRLLALNASVFSLVWANREGGEHVSSWRNRLREIKRLRERCGPKNVLHQGGVGPSSPGTALGGGAVGNNAPQMEGNKSVNAVRDSFGSSIRRSSVATFFSSANDSNSHPQSYRSSTLSPGAVENTDVVYIHGTDSLVEQVDFSKWA